MSTVAKLYIRKLGSLWADKIHPALTIHLTLFWNKNTCIKIANEKTLFCMKELKRPCRESLSFVLEMTIAPRAIMQNWQWPAERRWLLPWWKWTAGFCPAYATDPCGATEQGCCAEAEVCQVDASTGTLWLVCACSCQLQGPCSFWFIEVQTCGRGQRYAPEKAWCKMISGRCKCH